MAENVGVDGVDSKPKRRLPLLLEAFLMLFVPVIGFVLFSFVLYPMQPHCSLGSGALGCTPMCEPISYSQNGSPTDYKVTPCFHEEPSGFQTFGYRQTILYYLLFALPSVFAFILLGSKGFYHLVLRLLFYPYFLLKDNRITKNVISKIIVMLLFIPLFLEWGLGYWVMITTVLGISPF